MTKKIEKVEVGKVFTNKRGSSATVTEIINMKNVTIKFNDKHGYRLRVEATQLRRGEFKNPYHPIIHGVGYIGVGDFIATTNRRMNKSYRAWVDMLDRCYSDNPRNAEWYSDCEVNPLWHNYQDFALWYTGQLGHDASYELDKDILVRGNRVYGPDACCLVPTCINKLLLSRAKARGDLPIGVSRNGGMFLAKLSINGKQEYLGTFPTSGDAFLAYKSAKELRIKNVAMREYNPPLRDDVKAALMNYQIKITD